MIRPLADLMELARLGTLWIGFDYPKEVLGMSSSRRKSIGRGDEASGPVLDALASKSMARGESIADLAHHQYGTPEVGKYSRKRGGEYGASVSHLQ